MNPYQNFEDPEWDQTHPQPGAVASFDRFGWGGRGNDINPETGEEVAGTSGLARDVNRFQGMGQSPVYSSGPQINQAMPNESRGVTIGGLGLLNRRAMGAVPSVAEQAGTAQAQAGAANVASMGASVRGGAYARAAAARLARRQGAGIMQRQVGANLATRAGEMAEAREGLVGASGAMRQQDIGLAKEQAGLDVGQRQQNDQRENYYEDLAHDTKTAQLGARLRRTANEQAANSAANTQQRAAQATREQNTRDNIGTGVNAVSGGVSGYIKTHPNTGSEGETKTNVKPLDRVKKRSRDIVREYPTSGFDSGPSTDAMLDDRAKQNGKTPEWLSQAGDREIDRKDPYSGPRFGTRSHAMENPGDYERGATGAPKGYARMHKTSDTKSIRFGETADAPGTEDAKHGEGKKLDERSQLITQSPGDAKQDIKPLSEDEKRSMPWYRSPNPTEQKPVMTKAEADNLARGGLAAQADRPNDERDSEDRSWLDRVVGFVTGPVGENVIRDGRRHDRERRERETTLSPGETKEDVIDLDAPKFGRGGWDAGGALEQTRGMGSDTYRRWKNRRRPADEGEGHGDFMPSPEGGKYVVNRTGMHKATDRADNTPASIGRHGESVNDDTHFDADTDEKYSKVDPKEWRSDDELKADANSQMANMRANLARGPSTNRTSDLQVEALRQKADEMMGEFRAGKRPSLAERQDPYNEAPDLSSAARARDKAQGETPMDGALRALKPFEYEYKDGYREIEGQKPGEKNVGPMADEMDQDEVARTALTRDPRTGLRAIDLRKGLKLALAGLGHLQRKMEARTP